MRVLLTTVGSRGDVEPVAGLASALRELGARVTVCAPPDAEFAALFDRVGVPLVPLGPPVRSVVGGAKPPTPEDAVRLARDLVTARFEVLAAAAEGCDALLATGLMPAGAREVAEQRGIRYVFASLQRYGLAQTGERAREGAQRINGLYLEVLNRHRAELGLPPVEDVRAHVYTDRPWLAADPLLSPAPELPGLVQTGSWLLPDDRPLPAELTAFLAAGEPPVYVGFGSMAPYLPTDIAEVAVQAVRARGRRVVLASGWAGLSAAESADCFRIGEVNQQALFGRVAAVLHHGGAGTTTTAARAGAPQVVLPRIADQPEFAARVAELGIGAAHQDPAPTVDSLSAALATALAPETAARARSVAAGMRADGAHVAARMLLSP